MNQNTSSESNMSESPATPVADVALTGFQSFALTEELMKAVKDLGFNDPTEIQERTIPHLLGEDVGDLIALASTGSGKTAAFGIPLIEKMDATSKQTQGLIMCPTRELALQVSEQIQKLSRYKKLTIATIFGGGSYLPQEKALRKGAQIIVATPGRLIDFIEQGLIDLKKAKVLVLDEADEMVSLGFKDALEKILGETSEDTAKWMFSATMDKAIRSIADNYLKAPHVISHNKSAGLSETIEQIYMTVKRGDRDEALLRIIELNPDFYGIVFCQTKLEVAELHDKLVRSGLRAASIHGDLKQAERTMVLRKFKEKDIKILVATDVAARGIDVKDLTHVVNHSLPWDVESYIHRIGRTARNGQKGVAISLISPDQMRLMARILQKTGRPVKRVPIPTADQLKESHIRRALPDFVKPKAAGKDKEKFDTLVNKVAADLELDLESLTAVELIQSILYSELKDRFTSQREDLDYLPPDKVPRELSGEGGRYSRDDRGDGGFRGGDRGGRGGFRGGDRGGRGGFSRRDDRGGDRGERSDRPSRSFSGPRDDRPRSEGFGGERSERPARSFRSDREERPARTFGGDREERPARTFAADRDAKPAKERTNRYKAGMADAPKSERAERAPRAERPERSERSERGGFNELKRKEFSKEKSFRKDSDEGGSRTPTRSSFRSQIKSKNP